MNKKTNVGSLKDVLGQLEMMSDWDVSELPEQKVNDLQSVLVGKEGRAWFEKLEIDTEDNLGPRHHERCICSSWQDRVGCSDRRFLRITYPDGKVLRAIPWDGPGRCHDCMAMPGRRHHPSCDMEICPRCTKQFVSCFCLLSPKDYLLRRRLIQFRRIEQARWVKVQQAAIKRHR